jgi:hypothetical protein
MQLPRCDRRPWHDAARRRSLAPNFVEGPTLFMVEALKNDELIPEAPAVVGRQTPVSRPEQPARRTSTVMGRRQPWQAAREEASVRLAQLGHAERSRRDLRQRTTRGEGISGSPRQCLREHAGGAGEKRLQARVWCSAPVSPEVVHAVVEVVDLVRLAGELPQRVFEGEPIRSDREREHVPACGA